MSIWIARDKDGSLFLYSQKPERDEDCFAESSESSRVFVETDAISRFIEVSESLYPEVTWENSPKELIV